MRDDPQLPGSAARELMGHPAVDRARAAQHLVRTVGYQPERFARMRDEAVHVALSAGISGRRLAEAMEVRPEDVERMSRDHAARVASPSGDAAPGRETPLG